MLSSLAAVLISALYKIDQENPPMRLTLFYQPRIPEDGSDVFLKHLDIRLERRVFVVCHSASLGLEISNDAHLLLFVLGQ
jgi:hypothetical protein